MRYTLITPKGQVYQFYLEATALIWKQAYGGTLFDNSVVQTAKETV